MIASKNITIVDNNLMNSQGGMMLDVTTLNMNNGSLIIKGIMGI